LVHACRLRAGPEEQSHKAEENPASELDSQGRPVKFLRSLYEWGIYGTVGAIAVGRGDKEANLICRLRNEGVRNRASELGSLGQFAGPISITCTEVTILLEGSGTVFH